MFENKTALSQSNQDLLIKKLISWNTKGIELEKDAFFDFYNNMNYLLIMSWQCRFDKMNSNEKSLNIWISENYLPKEYDFDKKSPLKFIETNHNDLAQIVLKSLWNDYLTCDLENIVKPKKEKISFFKKLFK